MIWKHRGIYQSLKSIGHPEKKSNSNKYIFLTKYNQIEFSFAILYDPESSTGQAMSMPLHLITDHEKWDESIDGVRDLAVAWGHGRHEEKKRWRWYKVNDWDALAKALRLD